MRFLRVTYLWILLSPIALIFVGAMSNQAVLMANGGRFPVLVNDKKAEQLQVGKDGMMDDTHCRMTAYSRLTPLADIFDLGDAIYSFGDGLLYLGFWSLSWAPFVWVSAVVRRLKVVSDSKA